MRKKLFRIGLICNRTSPSCVGVDQAVHEWAVRAARECGPHLPLLIPALTDPLDPDDVVESLDGFIFPGGISNVHPARYGAVLTNPKSLGDPARDGLTLPLLKAVIASGKPVLSICRGFQELNVALGGTLHQSVHKVPGRLDHRASLEKPMETKFAPVHEVMLEEGGLLARMGLPKTFTVNSLHGQGVDRLAGALSVEARASDGQIEAVSMPDAPGFVLGVQWHPEWRWAETPASRAIFNAFAASVAR